MLKDKPRGGVRDGAGRKPLHQQPLQRISVSLSAADITRLRHLGEGNVSEGVRIILRRLRQ